MMSKYHDLLTDLMEDISLECASEFIKGCDGYDGNMERAYKETIEERLWKLAMMNLSGESDFPVDCIRAVLDKYKGRFLDKVNDAVYDAFCEAEKVFCRDLDDIASDAEEFFVQELGSQEADAV